MLARMRKWGVWVGLVGVLAVYGCAEANGGPVGEGGAGGDAGAGGAAGTGGTGGMAGTGGTGGAVGCTGTPTPGIMVDFPTMGASVPVFEDTPNGYRVTPGGGNVTFTTNGLGSDGVGPVSLNPGESLTWAFFEEDSGSLTNPATATHLDIWFVKVETVELDLTAVDGSGGMLGPVTITGRRWLDISALFGDVPLHQVTVAPTAVVPPSQTSILRMRYDHDCL